MERINRVSYLRGFEFAAGSPCASRAVTFLQSFSSRCKVSPVRLGCMRLTPARRATSVGSQS
ncbi:uncharacterized protein PHALS_09308 [Plasmopara halstedii]|uniref:Uncharacterized protein n=1 Tax=Plasmopara halstedii TaxID=4781 RepID=A0A0P1AFP9_PLAHL|nr:uncharacterized protein PHALS_09308 [Plasmopara halstedii]CEG39256.1 hypothetical protein PHALS_09308 [Plasmopara halstedii]|eukprot:XP_024575625.1 hypothetical protein PHALS_09308 [Plasmopara halstedii]